MLTDRKDYALRRSTSGGFALIEALIALLVVAFGLLAIASFQYSLSRASDVAKQRSEATRIAQREIDRLRSFGQRQSDSNTSDTRYTYIDDVVSTSAAIAVPGMTVTNTTYQLQRQVRDINNTLITAATSPTLNSVLDRWRSINVVVSWTDRAGQAQDVRLATSISDGDAGDLGPLGVRRRPGTVLRPKNRNINVPYPAVNVAACPTGVTGGCSAFVAPPGNRAYVFSNDTGNVVQWCELRTYAVSTLSRPTGSSNTVSGTTAAAHPFTAGTWINVSGVTPSGYNGNFRLASGSGSNFSYVVPDNSLATPTLTTAVIKLALFEGININGGINGVVSCSTPATPAYLVSGFVRFVDSDNPSADALINPNGPTFDLHATTPLQIVNSVGAAPAATTCTAQRQKVLSRPNVRAEEIRSYARSGNVVTITTRNNHAFEIGMVIAVSSTPDRQLPDYRLQGQFEVTAVTTNTLTYVDAGDNVSYTGSTTSGQVEVLQQITLAETDRVPTGYNQTESTFVSYTCVVTPSSTGSPEWWGRLNLVPASSWSTSTYTVCRYTADYNNNGLSNSDHPQYYRQVTGSLDSQNFAVIRGTCPTDTPPTFTGNQIGDFYNTNTVAHQPSGSASPGEPASQSTAIAMQ